MGRLQLPQHRCTGTRKWPTDQQHRRNVAGGFAGGLEVGVVDAGPWVIADQFAEGCVGRIQDPRDAAEVDPQTRLDVLVADRREDLEVSASEAIDRLLGVADEEQAAAFDRDVRPDTGIVDAMGPCQQVGDLGLDRVGVLELVDEQGRPLVVQALPHLGVFSQHVTGQHQQVVVGQCTRVAATLGLIEQPVLDACGEGLCHSCTHALNDVVARLVRIFQRLNDLGLVQTCGLPVGGLAARTLDVGRGQGLQQVR